METDPRAHPPSPESYRHSPPLPVFSRPRCGRTSWIPGRLTKEARGRRNSVDSRGSLPGSGTCGVRLAARAPLYRPRGRRAHARGPPPGWGGAWPPRSGCGRGGGRLRPPPPPPRCSLLPGAHAHTAALRGAGGRQRSPASRRGPGTARRAGLRRRPASQSWARPSSSTPPSFSLKKLPCSRLNWEKRGVTQRPY